MLWMACWIKNKLLTVVVHVIWRGLWVKWMCPYLCWQQCSSVCVLSCINSSTRSNAFARVTVDGPSRQRSAFNTKSCRTQRHRSIKWRLAVRSVRSSPFSPIVPLTEIFSNNLLFHLNELLRSTRIFWQIIAVYEEVLFVQQWILLRYNKPLYVPQRRN